jgi:hypothetical protein
VSAVPGSAIFVVLNGRNVASFLSSSQPLVKGVATID